METFAKRTAYQTMSEIAVAEITDAILQNELKPGTRLIPGKLEKEMNLGRVAIREAIKELSCKGLVDFEANKGAVVAKPPKMEEIKEIFEIRYMLEGKAAQIAAEKMSAKEIVEIEGINQKLSEDLYNSNNYFRFNREFHRIIYTVSGWAFLCRIITQLYDQVFVFRNIFPFPSQMIQSNLNDHELIINAIKQRDSQLAREVMISHLKKGFENLQAMWKQKQGI
jgi:DNA-binding GntR family transcriptional regulator